MAEIPLPIGYEMAGDHEISLRAYRDIKAAMMAGDWVAYTLITACQLSPNGFAEEYGRVIEQRYADKAGPQLRFVNPPEPQPHGMGA